MKDGFILCTEDTIKRFDDVSFSKVVPVISLLLENNQRKTCILGGTLSFQTAGTNTGCTPLKLITWYKELEE